MDVHEDTDVAPEESEKNEVTDEERELELEFPELGGCKRPDARVVPGPTSRSTPGNGVAVGDDVMAVMPVESQNMAAGSVLSAGGDLGAS